MAEGAPKSPPTLREIMQDIADSLVRLADANEEIAELLRELTFDASHAPGREARTLRVHNLTD